MVFCCHCGSDDVYVEKVTEKLAKQMCGKCGKFIRMTSPLTDKERIERRRAAQNKYMKKYYRTVIKNRA